MTWAIIQARLNSSRLPGKVLLKVDKRPLLSYMVERIQKAKNIDGIVIATTVSCDDDKIENFCKSENISSFRGSEEDVLDRYYCCAKKFRIKTIIRLTSDCPLIDPKVIDDVIKYYFDSNFDYVANTLEPCTYPDGMDVEVFSFEVLESAWKEANKPSHREHVTFYIWQNPKKFKIGKYNYKTNLSEYRLTIDYQEDFQVIEALIKNLYPKNSFFSMEDIVDFLKKHPEIEKINQYIQRNQGWQSAFIKDKNYVYD